eukprot:881167-Pleurochrysis_carterae.AAC.3
MVVGYGMYSCIVVGGRPRPRRRTVLRWHGAPRYARGTLLWSVLLTCAVARVACVLSTRRQRPRRTCVLSLCRTAGLRARPWRLCI